MEQIPVDWFNNNFTIDPGATEKNIPSLGEIDKKVIVHAYLRLNYSSSSPRNSEISTVLDIMITTVSTTDIGHPASKEF